MPIEDRCAACGIDFKASSLNQHDDWNSTICDSCRDAWNGGWVPAFGPDWTQNRRGAGLSDEGFEKLEWEQPHPLGQRFNYNGIAAEKRLSP